LHPAHNKKLLQYSQQKATLLLPNNQKISTIHQILDPYSFTMGWEMPPPVKIAPSWGSQPILGSYIPNGTSIGSAVFVGLMAVTDRHTDHATAATIGRILCFAKRCANYYRYSVTLSSLSGEAVHVL